MHRPLPRDRLGDKAIQRACWDAKLPRVSRRNRRIKHLRGAKSGQRRDGDDRRKVEEGRLAANQAHRRVKGETILINQVPLIHHDHEPLPSVNYRTRNMKVLRLESR